MRIPGIKALVRRAIGHGVLQPEPCETCGELKTEAHHDDYGIPLGVRWLCRKHHCQWHRRNGPGLNRPSKYRHRPKNVDQQREERITAIVDEAMASLRIQWQREPAEGRAP